MIKTTVAAESSGKSTHNPQDSGSSKQSNWQILNHSNSWRPPTDVYETEQDIIIKVEIAGMNEEDFQIIFNKNTLIINGFRKDDILTKKAFHQVEIGYGDFTSVIELSIPIRIEDTEASYNNGFLSIVLPKALPKKIKIKKAD